MQMSSFGCGPVEDLVVFGHMMFCANAHKTFNHIYAT